MNSRPWAALFMLFLLLPTAVLGECAYAREKTAAYRCIQQTETPAEDSFFSDSLMIGDSICASLDDYDALPELWFETKIGQSAQAAYQSRNVSYQGTRCTMASLAGLASPERLFIMLGSNGLDLKTPEAALSDYHAMLDAILREAPETTVYIVSLTPVLSRIQKRFPGLTSEAVAQFNAMLLDLAQEHGIHYIDVATPLLDEEGKWAVPDYVTGDGLHLTRAGAQLVAQAIRLQVCEEE